MPSFNRNEKTQTFRINRDKNAEMREILLTIYDALSEKGYNPVNQIVGYLLSEDPTYITSHNNARVNITRLDRFDILTEILDTYFNK